MRRFRTIFENYFKYSGHKIYSPPPKERIGNRVFTKSRHHEYLNHHMDHKVSEKHESGRVVHHYDRSTSYDHLKKHFEDHGYKHVASKEHGSGVLGYTNHKFSSSDDHHIVIKTHKDVFNHNGGKDIASHVSHYEAKKS